MNPEGIELHFPGSFFQMHPSDNLFFVLPRQLISRPEATIVQVVPGTLYSTKNYGSLRTNGIMFRGMITQFEDVPTGYIYDISIPK